VDRLSSTSNSDRSSARFGWKRLPLGALFAGALLCTVELGTRLFFRPPYVSVENYADHYPLAPLYGLEGSRACFRVRGEMSCLKTQDMNIIPQTFPLKKPAGELRVIVLGSSVSWEGSHPGQGKSDGNYPSRTLSLLERAHPGRALRLINLSVPGFGSSRVVVRLREALEYEPDLLIVHTHDTNEIREDQRRAYVKALHAGVAGKLLYLYSVVVLHEFWAELFEVRSTRRAAADIPDETEGLSESAKIDRWHAGLERNVQTMLDLAKARGVPVILVGPSRADDHGGVRGRPLNRFLSTRVSSSVQFLDVVELFLENFAQKRRRLFKDRVHYSAEGTRVVAGALAPLVEAALPALREP
jgi:hypothetical protein